MNLSLRSFFFILSLFLFFPCFLTAASVSATVEFDGGLFFEAEDYMGRPFYSDESFGEKISDSNASGGTVVIGLFQKGALSYRLTVEAGDYQVWLRCAVPGTAKAHFGANCTDESQLQSASLAKTTELGSLSGEKAYRWQKLGMISLQKGENTFILGQGALRADCFFLTRKADYEPADHLPMQVRRAQEAPKGKPLPELRHDRRISNHPRWLIEEGLRAAYGHFEWDPANTPQSWAKQVREAGGNCLFAVGEMPAGTLDGKLKAYPFAKIDEADFQYPDKYRRDDYSWVKEFVDAGHAEGLKVVIYDGSHRTLDPLLLDHPEWRQRDASGKVYKHGFGSWHSPYRAAYIDRWVQVAKQSGLDGIMVDMLFTAPKGGDYSDWTVAAFKKKFGVEPPRKEDPRDLTWQRWIDFQIWTREELILDVTEALNAVNPEIACIWNQTVGWVFDGTEYLSSRAAQCGNGLLEEMGWEISRRVTPERPFAWPIQSAWQNLFLHCRTSPGYGLMWHVNGIYTDVNHEALAYSMFANGVAPGVVTGGNWDSMKRIWSHVAACEQPMKGASLTPYAAIHFSERSLARLGGLLGDQGRRAYLENVFGMFQSLLETHVPVAILTDDDLEKNETLDRYPCVILPNSTCLGDRQAKALARYAEMGGGLVITYETGSRDENGFPRAESAVRTLLGVEQKQSTNGVDWQIRVNQKHEILNTSAIREGGDTTQGARERKPHLMLFRSHVTRPAGIVRTVPLPDSALETVSLLGLGDKFSLLHTHRVGKGRVAYFPGDMGRAYFSFNHPITRLILDRSVRWAAGTPPQIETNAPLTVQTVCFEKGDSAIIHLVNDISSFGRSAAPNPESFGWFRDEVLPVHEIAVSLRGDFARVTLLPEGKELGIECHDGVTKTVVPRLDIHSMIVFEK